MTGPDERTRRITAERDRLRDGITALADEWEREEREAHETYAPMPERAAALRKLVTP